MNLEQEIDKQLERRMPLIIDKVRVALSFEKSKLMSIKELAKEFGKTEQTIRRWIKELNIESRFKLPGDRGNKYAVSDFNVIGNEKFEQVYNACKLK